MSADDNPLDYLHVPVGPVDAAITAAEDMLQRYAHRLSITDVSYGEFREFAAAVVKALRELDAQKRSRW